MGLLDWIVFGSTAGNHFPREPKSDEGVVVRVLNHFRSASRQAEQAAEARDSAQEEADTEQWEKSKRQAEQGREAGRAKRQAALDEQTARNNRVVLDLKDQRAQAADAREDDRRITLEVVQRQTAQAAKAAAADDKDSPQISFDDWLAKNANGPVLEEPDSIVHSVLKEALAPEPTDDHDVS